MKSALVLTALLLAGAPALAQHEHGDHGARPPAAEPSAAPAVGRPSGRVWTRYPVLLPGMVKGERSAALLRPQGMDTTEVVVLAADGPPERLRVTYPVDADGARIQSATPRIGNYHWVTAREEREAEVRVASTVWYFANPGPAPTALLEQNKSELEIVPMPLPREHGSYREAEKWRFQVRFNGAPVADQPVTLESEFGSRSSFITDAQGIATILFPRDFRPAADSRPDESMGPRRAKFVLASEKDDGGKHYLTAFNYTYSPDPGRDRSLAWGAAFGVLGMVAATPLLRRRTSANKNDPGAGNA